MGERGLILLFVAVGVVAGSEGWCENRLLESHTLPGSVAKSARPVLRNDDPTVRCPRLSIYDKVGSLIISPTSSGTTATLLRSTGPPPRTATSSPCTGSLTARRLILASRDRSSSFSTVSSVPLLTGWCRTPAKDWVTSWQMLVMTFGWETSGATPTAGTTPCWTPSTPGVSQVTPKPPTNKHFDQAGSGTSPGTRWPSTTCPP